MLDTIIVVAVLAVLGAYVSWRAGRLDRLHARLDAARAALDTALVRRSSVARELAESDLTRALRAAFGQPGFVASVSHAGGAEELLAEMEGAAHQVFLARKFYNDAVAATRAARRRPLARLAHLAGSAPLPEFFEIDDSLAGADPAAQSADMPHLTGTG